ncbi:GNAT family N-acetyltransferase [Litorivivens sp.]|uniref:GNAT family N-acetyltransferase n=1 Tax=Litorivivens sp. TaxID=2020868 RepID=UPI00356AE4BA
MIYRLSAEYFVRVFDEADLDGPYPLWFQDQEVCSYNGHGKFFYSREALKSFALTANSERQIVWAICHGKDGHIGNISLQNISSINRVGELAILIGAKSHWGAGVGHLAGMVLLRHGFQKLGLEKIYCGTADCNTGMKKLALSLGMQHEGTRRSHVFLNGKREDVVEYGVLRTEFLKLSDS